jgi:hypothetical protein
MEKDKKKERPHACKWLWSWGSNLTHLLNKVPTCFTQRKKTRRKARGVAIFSVFSEDGGDC